MTGSSLYIVGGRQKRGVDPNKTDEWHYFDRGVVLRLDLESGDLVEVLNYVSPPDVCPDRDPSILFKSATLDDDRLYLCTQTEVMVYELPAFRRLAYVTLPCFNDLHHVRPTPQGSLIVTNTGLDMVVEVTPAGDVLNEWAVIDEPLWTRFDRSRDYRKVLTTKPHIGHPNHTMFLGGDLWVTRCKQSDAICLTASHDPLAVLPHRPIHDGLVRNGAVYFTQVPGFIAVADARDRTVTRMVDLNAFDDGTPLGWCRGVEVLDENRLLAGFSRLRPTVWRENVSWVKSRLGGDARGLRPTRVVLYDLAAGKAVWERNLEPAGMNAIFSMHLHPQPPAAP